MRDDLGAAIRWLSVVVCLVGATRGGAISNVQAQEPKPGRDGREVQPGAPSKANGTTDERKSAPRRHEIQVERELYIAAPEGDAVYSSALASPTYVRPDGQAMIEVVRHEAMHFMPTGKRQYYAKRLYRRRSEDNGKTWRVSEELDSKSPEQLAGSHRFPGGIMRLPGSEVLMELEGGYENDPKQPMFSAGNMIARTYRSYYRLSHDGGVTWTPNIQIIDSRPEYTSEHWGPGLQYGHTGAVCDGQPVFLADGTLVIGFTMMHPRASAKDSSNLKAREQTSVMYAQGRYDPKAKRLTWKFGNEIRVPLPIAQGGCNEPCATLLADGSIFNSMRCQGDEKLKIYSSRQTTASKDGGLTWSEPAPLKYDDDQPVWTPAALQQFFTSTKTGRTYVLGNFLGKPTFDQVPRYPLCIAEFDLKSARVLRSTVQVIQDIPPGAPVDRRYTNWGQYEERGTGDLILLLPEQPKTMNYDQMKRPEDLTSDCIKFRIKFID